MLLRVLEVRRRPFTELFTPGRLHSQACSAAAAVAAEATRQTRQPRQLNTQQPLDHKNVLIDINLMLTKEDRILLNQLNFWLTQLKMAVQNKPLRLKQFKRSGKDVVFAKMYLTIETTVICS